MSRVHNGLRVHGYGNLASDPEVKALQDGGKLVTVNIAFNSLGKKGEDGKRIKRADFFRMALFGQQADFAEKYLRKGRLVAIEGQAKNRSWQGQDGITRYRTEFTVEDITPLSAKPKEDPEAGDDVTPDEDVPPPIGDDDIPL